MELITEYGPLILSAILVIVGLIGVKWAKSVANDKDDLEMAKNAKGFAAMGWLTLLIGISILIVFTVKSFSL